MQTPDNHFEKAGEGFEAPAKLVSALQQLPQPKVFIPPTLDETVLRAARQQLGGRGTSRFAWLRFVPRNAGGTIARGAAPWPRLVPWLAGATAVAAFTAILLQTSGPAAKFAREDLNQDGTVDILDAFLLARQVESGAPPKPGIDLNGDSVIDGLDVSLLAAKVVKLEKGGHS